MWIGFSYLRVRSDVDFSTDHICVHGTLASKSKKERKKEKGKAVLVTGRGGL
jgi:hypothetical protein